MSEADYIGGFKLANGEEIIAHVVEVSDEGWMIRLPKKYIHKHVTWLGLDFGHELFLVDWIFNLPAEEEFFLKKELVIWHGDPMEDAANHYVMNLSEPDSSGE